MKGETSQVELNSNSFDKNAPSSLCKAVLEGNEVGAKSILQNSVAAVLSVAATGDATDDAIEVFDVFQAALDCPANLLDADIIECLSAKVFGRTETDVTLRCCAGNFLIQAVFNKSDVIEELNITKDLMHICFSILTEADETDEEEEESPRSLSLRLLDTISNKLPDTEVSSVVIDFATSASEGEASQKLAALSALAHVCEGCAGALGDHTEFISKFACDALRTDSPTLQKAAFYALGQFAEQMHEQMADFAPGVLELAIGMMEKSPEDLVKHNQLEKAFYCIGFLSTVEDERVEDEIEKLLPSLMSSLKRFIQMGNSQECQAATHAVMCLATFIAEMPDDVIAPHLEDSVQMLELLLPETAAGVSKDADENALQASALDTMATVATAAQEAFVPFAAKSLSLTRELVFHENESEMRRAALKLACATVCLKNSPRDLLDAVPRILECLATTLTSTSLYFKGRHVDMAGVDEDNEDTCAHADEEIAAFIMENDLNFFFLEEKLFVIHALTLMAKKIADHLAAASTDLFEKCKNVTASYTGDISKFACAAMIHMGHVIQKTSGNETPLFDAVSIGIKKIGTDAKHDCALQILNEIHEVLDAFKKPIHTKGILETVRMALKGELACMIEEEKNEDEEDDNDAKLDGQFFDGKFFNAEEIEQDILDGSGVLLLAAAGVDPQVMIDNGLADILPAAIEYLQKPDACSKASVIRIIGDLFQKLGAKSAEGFVKELLPIFMGFVKSEDENIQSSIFTAIGRLLASSGETGVSLTPDFKKSLSEEEWNKIENATS